MHIPDGYISPSTAAAAFAAVTPFWIVAGRRVRATMRASLAPRLGLFAAFTFVLMMFNIPLAGGTSGHAVGGALMALVLGPWAAVLGVSVALAIQALLFAMIPSHALIAAPVEGMVTGFVWSYLRRAQPAMLAVSDREPGRYHLWPAWAALFLLALATPVGLLAQGDAWGEWGSDALGETLGFVPAGLARLEEARLPAWLPDYTVPGLSEPAGYVLTALLGITLAAAAGWGVAWLARGASRAAGEDPAEGV